MAAISHPRKNYRWRLEMNGLNVFEVQEVQIPSIEIPKIEHGSGINDPNKKTPGKVQFGDLVMKKLKSSLTADIWAIDKMAQAIAGAPDILFENAFLIDYNINGVTPVEKWFLGNCWVTKIEQSNRGQMSPGENIIETVTFSIDYFYNVNAPAFAALLATGAISGVAAIIGGVDR
jgi:phage tail-like protein